MFASSRAAKACHPTPSTNGRHCSTDLFAVESVLPFHCPRYEVSTAMSERPTGAAEKAVPRQNEGYSTDPHLGETAYAPRHRLYLVSPRPVPVSHPPAVEASPRGLAPQAPAL